MVEDRAERPQFRGISLFSPEEIISFSHGSHGSFVGKSRLIPDVGNVSLHVDKESFVYPAIVEGFTIENGQLVIERFRQGILDLSVWMEINDKRDSHNIINCQMCLPSKELIVLESKVRFDKAVGERLYAEAKTWDDVRENGEIDYYFFIPDDVSSVPRFLSELRFSFSSIFNSPEIQPPEK